MIAHLIHGIHTQGASPVQGLIAYLTAAGLTVKYPDYGFIFGVETRIVNPIIVGALAPYIAPTDIVIGHSNGCAIAYDLMRTGEGAAGAIFINGALEQAIVRPANVPWIDVYYNPGDDITEAAKIGAELRLNDAVWGEMGHAGYSGADPAITNVNCGDAGSGMPVVCGHSDFFTPDKLKVWGPYLARRLTRNLLTRPVRAAAPSP